MIFQKICGSQSQPVIEVLNQKSMGSNLNKGNFRLPVNRLNLKTPKKCDIKNKLGFMFQKMFVDTS